MNSGHPEVSMAVRLTVFESAHPDVMIWSPRTSASGKWEAMGDGWSLKDSSPSRLLDRVAKLVGDTGAHPAQSDTDTGSA
jgi:hypothetical protein